MSTVKQYKVKVNNKTVDETVQLFRAIRAARKFIEGGSRAFVTNYRNEVIWRPSDIIEEE